MKFLLLLALTTASVFSSPTNDTFTITSSNTGILNASYTASKVYIDEVSNDAEPLVIRFMPKTTNEVSEVELWTNLNNRSRATNDINNDGMEDGIVPPDAPLTKPEGYVSGPYPTNGYFNAIPVISSNNGTFIITTNATKTGVYRLTARYKVSGNTNWFWYNDKDHNIIVSPKISQKMSMYEINVNNVSADGTLFSQRSTFESLTNTNNTKVNLSWLKKLGVNTLWFQPFHPITWEARGTNDPGSPYSVKNFFEINDLMTSNYNVTNSLDTNRALALVAFTNFIAASDATNILVLIDAPFNHTAPDVEVDEVGMQLFSQAGINTNGWSKYDNIRDRVPGFFSRNDGTNAYAGPATSATNIAVAPDRTDFGKWDDVRDVFFGRYPYLVIGNPSTSQSQFIVNIMSDEYNYTDVSGGAGSAGAVTRATWKYFASYVPYWLEKTGLPANSSLSDQAAKGIDGIRADFGQGLPNQTWEYIINVARNHKWNFIFMTESLDGGNVTYRSSKAFEILNENLVFPLRAATTTENYKNIFIDRRIQYGQSLMLLNNTSHDEEGFEDPWIAVVKYAAVSTADGAPMIMYGQEIGTSRTFGFDRYEINFNKNIPDFKNWNSMMPQWYSWGINYLGAQHLIPVYNGIASARKNSAALKTDKRIFLTQQSNTNSYDPNIFAVVKYEQAGLSPTNQDVILGFVNLRKTNDVSNTFYISQYVFDSIGLQTNRIYNVKNTAAYLGIYNEYPNRRNNYLWGSGISGGSLRSNGVFVSLPKVPLDNGSWGTAPYEAQFLKLYDVTP